MIKLESEGKTVTDAVEAALKESGLRRDQVEVEILQEAEGGFMGFGNKLARIRITEKRWGDDEKTAPERRSEIRIEAPGRRREDALVVSNKTAPQQHQLDIKAACAKAEAVLTDIIQLIPLQDAHIQSAWDTSQERVRIEVVSPDASTLIDSGGRALESLQFLTTLIVSRGTGSPVAVQVDTLGFWAKRERQILDDAQQGVTQVRATGKPYRLSPMDAATRRLVHRSLADQTDIVTVSEGEGPWRKIVLRPRSS